MSGQKPPDGRPTPARPNDPAKPPGMQSIVQAIVNEQKEQKTALKDALNTKSRSRRFGPVAAVVLVVANIVGWVIIPPAGGGTVDLRAATEVERDLRVIIASAASGVEVWRSTNGGRLPATLAEAGVTDPGLTFTKLDSATYEIRGEHRGSAVTYRSTLTLTDFLDANLGPRK